MTSAHAGTRVLLQTNKGDITLELADAEAPKTVENFLEYVNTGFYNGLIFHRVISGFMIQGGGFSEDFEQKQTRAEIENEAGNGLENKPYTISMARTSAPHSATAQFFINVADNSFLNFRSATPQGYGYAVFGRVIEGTDVVDSIAAGATGAQGPFPSDVPKNAVIIESASILK